MSYLLSDLLTNPDTQPKSFTDKALSYMGQSVDDAAQLGKDAVDSVSSGKVFTEMGNFLLDAATSNYGMDFAEASVVSLGTDIANIFAGVFDTELKAEDYMSDSAADFYKNHKIGVSFATLVGGEATAATKMVNVFGKYARGGLSIFNGASRADEVKVINDTLKQVGLFSETYRDTVNALATGKIVQSATKGIATEAAFSMLAQHNYLMEDYDMTDFAIGAGISGVAFALGDGVAAATKLRKEAASQSEGLRKAIKAATPEELFKADIGSELALKHAALQKAQYLSQRAELKGNTGLAADLQRYAIDLETELNDSIDKLFSKEIKRSKDNRYTHSTHDNASLFKLIKADVSDGDAMRFAGVSEIRPVKVERELAVLGKSYESRKTPVLTKLDELKAIAKQNKNVAVAYGALKQAKEADSPAIRKRLMAAVDNLVEDKKINRGELAKVNRVVGQNEYRSLISTVTGKMFTEADAVKYANGVDFGIRKPSGLKASEQSTPQLQYTLAHKARNVLKSNTAFLPDKLNNASSDYTHVLEIGLQLARADKLPKNAQQLIANAGFKDITELQDYVRGATKAEIAKLADAGLDTYEIAQRTGLTIGNVKDFQIADIMQVKVNPQYRALHEGIDKEFKRSIFQATGHTKQLNQATQLDSKYIHSVNKTTIDESAIKFSGSAKDIVTRMVSEFSPYHDTAAKLISDKLDTIAGETYTGLTRTLGSADFVLRHQDVVNATVKLGDAVKNAGDDLAERWAKPLVDLSRGIVNDNVSRITMNQHINWLHSQRLGSSQYIDIVDGKLTLLKRVKATDAKPEIVNQHDVPLDSMQVEWFKRYRAIYQERLGMENLVRDLQGKTPLSDLGIKLPSPALDKKLIAYVIQPNKNTRLLTATTRKELEALVKAAREAEQLKSPEVRAEIVYRGSRFNKLHERADLENMEVANADYAKTSAAYTTVAADGSQLSALMNTLRDTAHRTVRKTAYTLNRGTIDFLDRMDRLYNEASLKQGINSGAKQDRTVYNTVKATMMNAQDRTILGENAAKLDGLELFIDSSIASLREAFDNILNRSPARALNDLDYDALRKEFDDAGLSLPFKNYEDMLTNTLAHKQNTPYTRRTIQMLAGTTTYFALRFLEAGHAIVTALSTPVMQMPEIHAELRNAGHGNFSAMKLLMEGVVKGFGAKADDVAFQQRMIDQKVIAPHVSEYVEQMSKLAVDPTIYDKVMTSPLFNEKLTALSDTSELLARQMAAGVGSVVARRVLPKGHSVAEHDAYVAAWVKRSMGNYNANQRPMMFQGTWGSALGLFQTYMLTMNQRIFKSLEMKDYKGLAALTATQASLFGLESLPGFDTFNNLIGSHALNYTHNDIQTSIYEQFAGSDIGENVAETILYGLPSAWLDSSLFTRATLDVRTPIKFDLRNGIETDLAVLSPVIQGYKILDSVGSKFEGGAPLSDAMLTALQQQSLSRPLARAADLVAGNAVDQAGRKLPNVGESGYKLYTHTLARLIATRPLQETALREIKWNNTFYASQDREARHEAISALRAASLNGSLDNATTATIMQKYLQAGGSERRWYSLLNETHTLAEKGMDISLIADKETAQHKIAGLLVGDE